MTEAALRAFRACYKEGYQYKGAGVIVSGISSDKAIQLDIFDVLTPEQRSKYNRLSEVVDTINRKMGNDTVILGLQQFPKDPKTGESSSFRNLIKHEHRSKCYTPKIDELIKVK